MARRGHHEGSIYRREEDGLWIAAYTVRPGQRKYLNGKTRQEVQQKLAKTLAALEAGLPLGDPRQATGEYFTRWLETVRPTIKPNTARAYERDIRLRIVKHVGKVKLSQLTPQHVQSFYAAILASGRSSTTARHCHNVLHHGLDAAMRLGLIARNVSELVIVPRKRETEMHIWSVDEVRQFLNDPAVVEDRQYALYLLALSTGMRLGEILALTWRNVDLAQRSLQVRSTVVKVRGGFEFGEPKTKRSRRQIPFPTDVAEALRAHRLRQLEDRRSFGAAWTDNGLVFPDESGQPLSTFRVYPSHFLGLVRVAGVPEIRFHDLRHTAATILLGRGINPKIVSEMLGHSSVAITLDTYSHVLPHMQRAASDEMASALFGPEVDH